MLYYSMDKRQINEAGKGVATMTTSYIVTSPKGPTFIADNQADAYQWAVKLIEKGYTPQIAVYGRI